MNASNFVYSIKQGFKNIYHNRLFSLASMGTIAACLFLFGVFYFMLANFQYMIKEAETSVGVTVFFLPHMHERYFYAADIFSVALAFAVPLCFPVALLVQFASLLGYHAYLKMRYLLLMNYGSAALIVAFFITLLCFLSAIREGLPKRRRRKSRA